MSTPSNGSEPSMEEILASIRALVSQDSVLGGAPAAPAPSQPQPAPQQATSPAQDAPRQDAAKSAAPEPGPAPVQGTPSPVLKPLEDDLDDLLDDPLPQSDTASRLSSIWSTSPADSGAKDPEKPGPSGSMTVAEAMGFDFGAMVPSRDAPPSEGDRGAPASPFGRPAADAKAPQPAARSNDVSLNWSPSMSGGQGAAAPPATNGSATPKPADAMSALTAKPAGGPELKAPARDNAGSTVETKAPSGLGAAVESASKFFSASPAPVAGAPSTAAPNAPAPTEAKLVPVPGQSVSGLPASGQPGPSQDPSRPAQKEPLIAGFSPVKSTPAPAHNERPSERPAAPAFGAAKPAPAAAPEAKPDAVGVPSIEPVLKAFGRIGGKEDDSAAKPATSETKADIPAKDAGAKPAAAVPATIHLPGPAATTTAAPQPAAPATGGRTLEDAVMELLRPMLKEWLDDNLPRIIEDAVRKEVAGAVKNAGLSSKV